MKVVVVTKNPSKFNEIATVLKNFGIEAEQAAIDVAEYGDTVEEIARHKARTAFGKIKKPLIADDTGIFFDAVPNFPGAFPRRAFEKFGHKGLLEKLNGKVRSGYFKTAVCYADGEREKLFVGVFRGRFVSRIHKQTRPELPYEQFFVPRGYKVHMASLPLEEKTKFSHRARAVSKFARWWIKNLSRGAR